MHSMRTQLTLFVDQAKNGMIAATQQYSHTKTCAADSSCLECKLKKNFSSWHSILGLPSQLTEKLQIPKKSTWFSTRVYKGKWISACTLCKEFRSMVQKNPSVARAVEGRKIEFFGKYRQRLSLTAQRLQKHRASFVHRMAERTLQDTDVGEMMVDRASPSADQFKRVWDATKKSGSKAALPDIGSRFKLARMRFCLAESIRTRHRTFLRDIGNGSVAIHGDKRKALIGVQRVLPKRVLHSGAGKWFQSLVDVALEIVEAFSMKFHADPKDPHLGTISNHLKGDSNIFNATLNHI